VEIEIERQDHNLELTKPHLAQMARLLVESDVDVRLS